MIVVVLPTYNERGTISKMLDALLAHRGLHVLVVDDDSPDGTAAIVRERMRSSSRVHLLTGPKQGLGVAYVRGIQYALHTLRADVVFEMDADFSHDPRDIPRMRERLRTADMVIGSRYVPGGSVVGWGPWRRTVSFGGNLVARVVAGIRGVRDTTAGFRAIRASVLSQVDWSTFPAKGYAFQIVLLHRLLAQGARVAEIPVTFTDRRVGASKLGFPDILEFFWQAARLGLHTYRRMLMFLVVGATGVLVNLGLFSLVLRVAGAPVWVSWAIAIEVSILWNFLLHEHWTFRDRRFGPWIVRCGKYHLSSLGGVVLNAVIFGFFVTYTGLLEELANGIAIAVATAWNYVLSLRWAWREDDASSAP